MAQFCRLVDELGDRADFLVVYIEEAHAEGENSFENNAFGLHQHKSLNDRIASAHVMIEALDGQMKCPVVVDDMDNNAMYAYGARPERMYILKEQTVIYQGNRGPIFNNFDEFEQALRSCLQE